MTTEPPTTCSYQYRSLSDTKPHDIGSIPTAAPDACPHPVAHEDDGRCLFHTAEREYPSDEIADAFLEGVSTTERPANFAGGTIGDLDLSHRTLETPDGSPIDLRGATIDGTLDLTEATVTVPLLLDNAAITGALEATDAHFAEPVVLAGASIGRRTRIHDAQFDGGIVANGLDAGFVDARGLSIDGPAIFDDASFNANTRFARSTINGQLSFTNADWRLLADFASVTVSGHVSFDAVDIGGEFRLDSASIEGGLSLADASVDAEARFCHTSINEALNAADATFAGRTDFEGVRYTGSEAVFDGAVFDGYTSFSLAAFHAPLSLADTTFREELWFTHGTFDGSVTFSQAQFEDFMHLRQATFGSDLVLERAKCRSQTFLHGSTIDGDVNAADAAFDHFQFSATVTGDADFRSAQFDARGIFARSEFGGLARFDEASFAGGPDFTDCRFLGEATFVDTEFLVEPTFDGTQFALEPDLEAATYPRATSRDLSESRKNLVVARPEELLNNGLTIPLDSVTDQIIVPAAAAELVGCDADRAKAVATALEEIEQSDWYALVDRSVELARTAVSELSQESDSRTGLVFGFELDPDADDPASILSAATLVAVYQPDENADEIAFSHLDPTIETVDHLVAVPASDDAFESGVAVGTHNEFRTAMIRRQALQLALLQRGASDRRLTGDSLPALVAVGHC